MIALRRLSLALLLLSAGCTSGAKLAAAKFADPAALAPFRGFTGKHPGEATPRAYLAVANRLRDELTILDPTDNELVRSATLAFPLSVPTRPRPFRLASAALEPPDATDPGADLLVVATQSPPALQLVTTWSEEVRAVDLAAEDDLATAFPGEAVLSLAAVTRSSGGAWVFVGLTGGNLAVLEFERDPTSALAPARRPVRRTALPLQRKELLTGAGRFDPLDLAVAPDASRLFAATSDPLHDGAGASVLGVGQLTLGPDASAAWPVLGLDARGPTRLLVAGSLAQRSRASSIVFESTPVLQVLAVLDEAGCGTRAAISCGLVTVLPDVGIAPDPVGELPYRAPIPLPRPATSLALVMPDPADDGSTRVGLEFAGAALPHLTLVADAALQLSQTALLVVGHSDGTVTAYDPGRWGPVNVLQSAEATHLALVSSISSVDTGTAPRLGLWTLVSAPGAPTVTSDATAMVPEVVAAPGYAADETFVVAWRGTLPAISGRPGVVQWDGGPVVALQAEGAVGGHIADPELGVRVGDAVKVVPASGACSGGNGPGFTAAVAAIRPADATFPGGALLLSHAGRGSADPAENCADDTEVVSAAGPGPVQSSLTVRAAGLVLSGLSLGYLGRPELDATFELRYRPEAGLGGEALAVGRKLRRRYYPADPECDAVVPGTKAGTSGDPVTVKCQDTARTPPIYLPADPDPLAPGPMLRFRLGLVSCPTPATCSPTSGLPGDGASLTLTTRSGLRTKSWSSGATRGPASAVTWLGGRSVNGTRATLLYVGFATDEVLSFVPQTGVAASVR